MLWDLVRDLEQGNRNALKQEGFSVRLDSLGVTIQTSLLPGCLDCVLDFNFLAPEARAIEALLLLAGGQLAFSELPAGKPRCLFTFRPPTDKAE